MSNLNVLKPLKEWIKAYENRNNAPAALVVIQITSAEYTVLSKQQDCGLI